MAMHKLISDITDTDMDNHNFANRTELLAFCDAVKQKLRGVKFAPKDGRSVWAYMPDQVYALGWIGYGDYRNSAEKEIRSYTVYSRNITNDGYADYSMQYHTRGSVRMEVAVRHASRYLTRYSPIEIAQELRKPFKDGASGIESEAKNELREQEKRLFDRSFKQRLCRVATELKVLLDTGYEFTDPAIATELRAYFTAEEEHNVLAKDRHADCVVVSEFMGKQRFQVVGVENAGNWNTRVHDNVLTYDDESLPGDLAGKLSVLSMCAINQYVTDVGVRVDERVFYVAR